VTEVCKAIRLLQASTLLWSRQPPDSKSLAHYLFPVLTRHFLLRGAECLCTSTLCPLSSLPDFQVPYMGKGERCRPSEWGDKCFFWQHAHSKGRNAFILKGITTRSQDVFYQIVNLSHASNVFGQIWAKFLSDM